MSVPTWAGGPWWRSVTVRPRTVPNSLAVEFRRPFGWQYRLAVLRDVLVSC